MKYDKDFSSCRIENQSSPLFGLRNPYLPEQAIIREIIVENSLVKTFILSFADELRNHDFSYHPGQFVMVSVPHKGEAPISFSSPPGKGGSFSLTVRRAGSLTTAMHSLQAGDMIGVRGPYGKPFPMEQLKGKNLLFVAGGIGMAPLRSALEQCRSRRSNYGRISLLYGCKHPDEINFLAEIEQWRSDDCHCLLTVDEPVPGWNGHVGLVTTLLQDMDRGDDDDVALVCGPGIMIRFVIERLEYMGFKKDNILTTLERHMKCGIGICGHCHCEEKLICADGPVFSRAELMDLDNL